MVRSELLQKMCNLNPNILRKDIEKIVEIIFHEFTNALCRGENIRIKAFGMFKITLKKARMGRNPKTSSMVSIPQKRAMRWKMSKTFFNRLNKNFTEDKIFDNNKN